MEIYVQETAALLYLKRVAEPAKERVLNFAALFPNVLAQSQRFHGMRLPWNMWRHLYGQEAWAGWRE